MWARVKGETENALLRLPFRAAYMLRPGVILPRDGIRSKTSVYQVIYSALQPAVPLLQRLFPATMLDTRQLGRAMLTLAAANPPNSQQVLENRDLIRLAGSKPDRR